MRNFVIIGLCLLFSLNAKAQFFGRKSIGIQQGAIFFNESFLNNKNNANDKTSWVTEVDKNLYISRFSSFNMGFGLGNYKNPDNRFEPFQSTNFFRLKFALVLHLPNVMDYEDVEQKRLLSPFFNIGYNFDVLNNTFKAIGSNRVNTNLKIGGGVVVKVMKDFGLMYSLTLNQRVNVDYRTFFQHNIGMLVRLSPSKPQSVSF